MIASVEGRVPRGTGAKGSTRVISLGRACDSLSFIGFSVSVRIVEGPVDVSDGFRSIAKPAKARRDPRRP